MSGTLMTAAAPKIRYNTVRFPCSLLARHKDHPQAATAPNNTALSSRSAPPAGEGITTFVGAFAEGFHPAGTVHRRHAPVSGDGVIPSQKAVVSASSASHATISPAS